MREKIVMITVALAVMIAMTGIGMAGSTAIPSPDEFLELQPLGTADTQIKYWGMASGTTQINWWFELENGDITSELNADDDADNSFEADGNFPYQNDIFHTLKVKNTLSTNNGRTYWLVTCPSSSLGVTNTCLRQAVSIHVKSIPEFPTVAAPIAAVLGLMFFFQRRKNKKE